MRDASESAHVYAGRSCGEVFARFVHWTQRLVLHELRTGAHAPFY